VDTFASLCDPDDPIFGDVKPMVRNEYINSKAMRRKYTLVGEDGKPNQKHTKKAPNANPKKRKH
jgi:hypothetical protein